MNGKYSDWGKDLVASVDHSMERVIMKYRGSQARSGKSSSGVRRGSFDRYHKEGRLSEAGGIVQKLELILKVRVQGSWET